MIDLSVIIVNYNGIKFLENCLNSVYNGTHQAIFEVIFIDNHSSDASADLVRDRFPKVKIIQNRQNLGFCKANNQGLKVYRGKYALLLNTDTTVSDGALDRMIEFMEANPKAGACGPKLLDPDGTPQHQGGLFSRKFWLSASPVKVDYVIGACLMVRREVVEKAGVMDENFFFSNEDLDWCRRIRKAGWQVYFLPQAEVTHIGGFTIKRFNQRLFVEGFRGGLYFCKKHYGFFIYQIYRALLVIGMLFAIPFAAAAYPLLKNKQKLAAFIQIFLIAIRGEILPAYAGNKNILLVSNGHAEDLAAAAIGAKLLLSSPDVNLNALPLVGLGKAYDRQEIENLGLKKTLPSGGFAKEGLLHFINDLRSGLFGTLAKQTDILRHEGKRTDLVVAVGDAFVVALCGLFARKPLIFVDGPKSVKIEGYLPVEKWLYRKFCRAVIVQDKETAEYLKKEGIPALFLGSWVMDYVPVTGENFGIGADRTVIGILPGTREEAYANLGLILEVFENMFYTDQNIIGLIASTLDREKIKVKGWELSGDKLISKSGATALIAEGKFGDVCVHSKLIIGLAGIANEQAAAFGKPVVCFPGTGAQTTLRRWQEIRKITGDSMLVLSGNAEAKAEKILELLHNDQKLDEMSRIGKASKPQWGGAGRIAKMILDDLH